MDDNKVIPINRNIRRNTPHAEKLTEDEGVIISELEKNEIQAAKALAYLALIMDDETKSDQVRDRAQHAIETVISVLCIDEPPKPAS